MRAIAGVLILAPLLIGCTETERASDTSASTSTTLYLFNGLECRADLFESALFEIDADAEGATDPGAEIGAFLDRPVNRRFSNLSLSERTGLRFSFADEDDLVQLVVQLIEASRGYVVGSYSYCVDGG